MATELFINFRKRNNFIAFKAYSYLTVPKRVRLTLQIFVSWNQIWISNCDEVLPSDQSRTVEYAKFTHSPFGFEKKNWRAGKKTKTSNWRACRKTIYNFSLKII